MWNHLIFRIDGGSIFVNFFWIVEPKIMKHNFYKSYVLVNPQNYIPKNHQISYLTIRAWKMTLGNYNFTVFWVFFNVDQDLLVIFMSILVYSG